jgi:hypothetical protein
MMLTIEHCDVTETISAGDLFDQIGFTSDVLPSDDSGDSYIPNQWGIEVLSLDGYYPIEGFRWTKPERQVKLFHRTTRVDVLKDCVSHIQCSPEHLVLRQGDDPAWVKVGDLNHGDLIVTRNGINRVTSVNITDDVDRLCDIQVAIAHSYFADDVLSHNSHFLTFLGANALRAGVDVLHYTFELSESAVGRRYDSNLCDVDSNDVIEGKDSIIAKYRDMKLGRLIIKEFPTNTATIYTLRSHIERLDLKGFRPGVIIIDYADIMRSTRQYDSLRHELKLIYEELRGFASEKSIPIWTASQSNKEGANSEVVDLGNMSEAYGKAMVADVVLSISRRAHEKSDGFGRLFVAKNRAGRDGIVYPVKIDTARSKFEITGRASNPEETAKDDEKVFKKALQNKWREVQADALLKKPGSDDPTGSNE